MPSKRIIVTSAAPPNGNGYGTALAFDLDGKPLGIFSQDPRIADPRGLRVDPTGTLLYLNSGTDRVLALDAAGEVRYDSGAIPGLNPGGASFGPDGRLYVTLRTERSVAAFSPALAGAPEPIFAAGIVPFPRGFAFGSDGRSFLASGIGPNGEGDRTVAAFASDGALLKRRLVDDPDLSPLDLTIAANGSIVVASEHPFGSAGALTTIREYDASTGELVRVFRADAGVRFRRPRGLRFDAGGKLFCVAQDEVVAFDFATGACLGAVVQYPELNGMALEFF